MSISPKGTSIQSIYRDYRNGSLIVNRKYQRKLVWTLEEKQKLIDTIIKEYPIPLFLLAEIKNSGDIHYEIIDGMQRLNAIFTFIENEFAHEDKVFDINELSRAKQLYDDGVISILDGYPKLEKEKCANFLDYQLAVTIYPSMQHNTVTEVFNRINSSGKQLSNQERRQAGVLNEFGDFIRMLASEIRGDVSNEKILLNEMPEISINSKFSPLNYGLKAEEILWYKHGIITCSNLRDSEDEEVLADITASILLDEPFERSRENLDDLYSNSDFSKEINSRLVRYGTDRLSTEIKYIFSFFKEILECKENTIGSFKSVVMEATNNPAKVSFYTFIMALYKLIIKEEKAPSSNIDIIKSIKGLQKKIFKTGNYTKKDDRIKNINIAIGLIQDYFTKKVPSLLGHGPSLAIDFENSLRRSKIETPRYEFKQGILNLNDRKIELSVFEKIINTICAIANLGKDSSGFLYIGIADKKADSDRIEKIDLINSINIGEKYIVGIDRECKVLKISVEQYMDKILYCIKSSKLSDPLKTQIQSKIDIIEYKNLSTIVISIPSQKEISYVDDKVYFRKNSSTNEASPKEIVAISKFFQ